jgi:hypothetical protein
LTALNSSTVSLFFPCGISTGHVLEQDAAPRGGNSPMRTLSGSKLFTTIRKLRAVERPRRRHRKQRGDRRKNANSNAGKPVPLNAPNGTGEKTPPRGFRQLVLGC